MIKANYITIDELKDWNAETDFSKYSAVTLSGMISRASRWVDKFLGYSLHLETRVGEQLQDCFVSSNGDLYIYPLKIPIVNVSKITLKLGSYSSDLGIIDNDGNAVYDIPEPKNHILYPYQEIQLTGKVSIRNFYDLRTKKFYVKLDYTAGYETIPDDIKDAVNLVAKDIFMRQANPMDLSSISQGAISMTYRKQEGGKSDLIKDAIRILNYYKKHW